MKTMNRHSAHWGLFALVCCLMISMNAGASGTNTATIHVTAGPTVAKDYVTITTPQLGESIFITESQHGAIGYLEDAQFVRIVATIGPNSTVMKTVNVVTESGEEFEVGVLYSEAVPGAVGVMVTQDGFEIAANNTDMGTMQAASAPDVGVDKNSAVYEVTGASPNTAYENAFVPGVSGPVVHTFGHSFQLD